MRFRHESTTVAIVDLLEKMSTYVRVVDAGSFSAAAKQLRLSAAAVSRQIAALEGELGVNLLARTTRRMAVTPAGRTYYERALRVLREVDEAQSVRRDSGLAGLVRLTAPVTFGLACVVPRLANILREHPELRIDLRLEDRFADLALEGMDIAVRVGVPPPESTELIAHRLGAYPRVVVAAPAYVRRRGEPRTPEALMKHAALTQAVGAGADFWRLRGEGREARIRLDAVARCNALYALRDLAERGLGIALLPDWFIAEAIERGSLRRLLPEWTSEPVTIHAIQRTEDRTAPRVRLLVGLLRAAYAATPTGAHASTAAISYGAGPSSQGGGVKRA